MRVVDISQFDNSVVIHFETDDALAIKQAKDPDTGIFTNIGYEVVEVHEHKPGIRQMPLSSEG